MDAAGVYPQAPARPSGCTGAGGDGGPPAAGAWAPDPQHAPLFVEESDTPEEVELKGNKVVTKDPTKHSAAACGAGGHGGHGERPPALLSAMASAVINFLLMFGLACSYGMVLFADHWNARHIGIGVKMNVGSCLIAGLVFSFRSSIPVAIAGPDITPVVFMGGFVSTIAKSIAVQLHLDYPEGGAKHRRLAAAAPPGSAVFCAEPDMGVDMQELCEEYHAQLLATSIFTVAFTSAVFAVIFMSLGKLRLTRYASFIPTGVMEAFLSCVGFKVFKFAMKFSMFEARQFIPAALIGVSMYFVKAAHMGNPAVVLPLLLLVPLGLFHIYVAVWGGGLADVRADDLMFPEIHNVEFYTLWTDGLFNFGKINIAAWMESLPNLAIMMIVVTLDCTLKISATESKLPVKYDRNHETVVAGMANIVNTLFGTAVGYMQLKFNVINYGIIGNVVDRRAGIIYALMSGLCFFWTIELINYLPRFFLSTMLFFAGTGFLAENLWGSRNFLSFLEWLHILIILAVFILTSQLLYAVLTGLAITGLDFLYQYSKVSTVRGDLVRGGEFSTNERRDPLLHFYLEHVMDGWLLVVRLKGFVFFATAQSLKDVVHKELVAQLQKPEYQRLRFLIFDCELLDGLDASTAKAFRTLSMEAAAAGVTTLWSCVTRSAMKRLVRRSVVTADSAWFNEFQDALLYVESQVVRYLSAVQQRWQRVHPIFQEYQQLILQRQAFEPFEGIFTKRMMAAVAQGSPWGYCKWMRLQKGQTLWQPRQKGIGLYIVHSGAIGLFKEVPLEPLANSPLRHGSKPAEKPSAVYQHGWILNLRALTGGVSSVFAVAMENSEVLCMDEESLFRMTREQPVMSAMIAKAVMKQVSFEEQLRAQRHRIASTVSDMHGTDGSDESGRLPQKLDEQLRSMRIAEALGKCGFYAAEEDPHEPRKEDVVQPPLAPKLCENLVSAFNCHAETRGDSTVLRPNRVCEALKYAGIFDTKLPQGLRAGVTKEDFLALSRQLLMAPLSPKRRESIRNMFARFDDDNSGYLDRRQIDTLFREHLVANMGLEDIERIRSTYAKGPEEGVHIEDFEAMMSRLIKAHELDWKLFCAVTSLMEPSSGGTGRGRLTPESLVAHSRERLTATEAEEMLWVADWHTGCVDGGKAVGLEGIVGALLLAVKPPAAEKPRAAELTQQPIAPKQLAVPAAAEKGRGLAHRVHLLLEQPASSGVAILVNALLGLVILCFLAALVLEPIITGHHPASRESGSRFFWWLLELVISIAFVAELLLRVVSAKASGLSWTKTLATPLMVCDILTVLPAFFGMHMELMMLRTPRLICLMCDSPLKFLFQGPLFNPAVCVMMVVWGIYLATPGGH